MKNSGTKAKKNEAPAALRLLGPPAVLVHGSAVKGLPRKLEALIYLLAITARAWSRQSVAEMLWDDRGATGRQNLRVALTKLPAEWDALLRRDDDQLALSETPSDLATWRTRCTELRQRAAKGDLDALAADLGEFAAWPGILLESLIIDAPEFDDWCFVERQRVQREWQSVVQEAVRPLIAHGRVDNVEAALTRVLDLDPGNETAHFRLIECYLAAGRMDAARSQYEICKRNLATMLGVKPSPALQQLFQTPPPAIAVPEKAQPSQHGVSRLDNLPRQVNSFIGRQAALHGIAQLLAENRLVTLCGAGGIGKTRLALQVGTALLARYPDGVWLADLTAASRDEQVPHMVAQALSVVEEPGRPILDTIERQVRNRGLLLILDNCEHVIAGAAELAHGILQSAAQVSILATSREWLHITGEVTFDVPTLDVPVLSAQTAVDALADVDAIRLFVDRARAARRDFDLDETNAAAVVDICRRLDGIPLALELAAARLRSLTVHAVGEHLRNRFALPGSGNRHHQPRQQTLEALIDWSYQLLTADEARLFRRLAVFAHGWTSAAAEAITADTDIPPARMVELLGNLVEKSLVVLDVDSGRYRMLEAIRHFGRDQLDRSGESDALRRRHVDYFLSLAETARPHLAGPDQAEWLKRLDAEQENLAAAFARTAALSDSADLAARLVHAVRPFWIKRGLASLGLSVVTDVLSRPALSSLNKHRFDVLFAAGQLCNFTGKWQNARRYLAEALDIARLGKHSVLAGVALQQLGMTCYEQGDRAAARDYLEQAILIVDAEGDKRELAACYNVLAQLLRLEGETDAAGSLLQRALILARDLDDHEYIACFLLNLTMLAIAAGTWTLSREMLLEAATLVAGSDSQALGQSVIEVCASQAAAEQDWDSAARFFAAAESQALLTGLQRDAPDEAFLAPWRDLTRNSMALISLATAEAAGRALTLPEALRQVRAWLRPPGTDRQPVSS